MAKFKLMVMGMGNPEIEIELEAVHNDADAIALVLVHRDNTISLGIYSHRLDRIDVETNPDGTEDAWLIGKHNLLDKPYKSSVAVASRTIWEAPTTEPVGVV